MSSKGATPILLLVATMSLVLALILTAVGLQVGSGEEILVNLDRDDNTDPNKNIAAIADSPATCSGTPLSADEWKTDFSLPEMATITKVEVFLQRASPGTATLTGGPLSVNSAPDTSLLSSITRDVTLGVIGGGDWFEFDFPDVDLDPGPWSFVLRGSTGAGFGWDDANSPQAGFASYCAGTSETSWKSPGGLPQASLRVHGLLRGTSTDGGDGPALFSRISPFFAALAGGLYAFALTPGPTGWKILESIVVAFVVFTIWFAFADALQVALGG